MIICLAFGFAKDRHPGAPQCSHKCGRCSRPAVRMFAPSEPTRFGSAMKIYKYIFAALTSLTFHVKHAIASVATKYLYFGITGHEHIGTLAKPKSQYDTKCQGDGCIFNYRTFSGRLSMCSGCFSLIAAILLVSLFIMWY